MLKCLTLKGDTGRILTPDLSTQVCVGKGVKRGKPTNFHAEVIIEWGIK